MVTRTRPSVTSKPKIWAWSREHAPMLRLNVTLGRVRVPLYITLGARSRACLVWQVYTVRHAYRSHPLLNTSRFPSYGIHEQGPQEEERHLPFIVSQCLPWGCHINSCNNYAEQINLHTWSPPPPLFSSYVSAPPNSPQANNTDIFFLLDAIRVETLLAHRL